MRKTLLLVLSAVVTATILVLAGSAMAAPSEGAGIELKLAKVRMATAKYKDVDAALAAGYVAPPPSACVPNMGYHYVNPALADDGRIQPRKPEVLVYAPTGSGKLRLVAVEYFAPAAAVRGRPMLFGVVPFDGPMPGHEPGMLEHYDLHAWIFKSNPDGVFAPFNPKVVCP